MALRIGSSRMFRLTANVLMLVGGLLVTVLASRHFLAVGWPLAHANAALAGAAGAVFLAGYGVKAHGWKLLFVPGERPGTASLAAAGGAASITGIALPGRFDDAVRIAVVRRHRGCPAGVKALMLSLFTLGLIDAVAMSPFASSAAAAGDLPTYMRLLFVVVAVGGIVAAVLVVTLPHIGRHPKLYRFGLVRWFCEQAPTSRAAGAALGFVVVSWLLRVTAVCLLLASLGLGFSISLALVFLCAGAASAALPIAPAGAATQTGAGAGALVATGMAAQRAVEFAVAAQVLIILAGVAAVLIALAWNAGLRVRERRTLVVA